MQHRLFLAIEFLSLSLWPYKAVFGTRGTELDKMLMKNYSEKVRPATKHDEKTDVYITLFIQHIEAVDDWRQTIKLHGAVHTYWRDQRLVWRPSDYNNTISILLSAWQIWTPDVRVLNSVDGYQPFYEMRHEAFVFYSGFVSMTRDFTFTTSCPLSHARYPHDRQRCPIVLSSLMYDYGQVDWEYGWGPEQSKVIEDRLDWRGKKNWVAGWEFVNATGRKAYLTRTGIQYDPPNLTTAVGWIWPMIIAEVEIVRHKPYFYIMEMMPILVTAVLTLTSFWIVDAPLLTMAMLMGTVIAQGYFSWGLFQDLPPATDGIPRLAVAYAFNFSMTCIAFLLHVLIHYLSEEGGAATSAAIPTSLSNWVDVVHKTKVIGGHGIHIIPSPPSQSDLAKLTGSNDQQQQGQIPEKGTADNITINARNRIKKLALVARRVFFWAYLVTYSIFAIAIAV